MAQNAPVLQSDREGVEETADSASDAILEDVDTTVASSAPIDLQMPKVSYDDARRIMTRTDFLEPLDHLHVGHSSESRVGLGGC